MNRLTLLIAVIVALLGDPVAVSAVNIQQNGNLNYTPILQNGPSGQKYDIVFIGDGFTAKDQTVFNDAVNAAVEGLRARSGYSETMCGFNIWRVNVVSNESGIDHPVDNIVRDTELDCRYGNPANGEAERCIRSDSFEKCFEAAAYAPDSDATFVLVNDTQWGGCAGSLIFSSISPGFTDIVTHELGHKIGGLADEYQCYVCDGSDGGRPYTGGEPLAVNLTIDTNRDTTKWRDLIDAATPLPTTVDTPPGVVGLVEGGGYFATGIFRPQFNCHMRTSILPFCAVCIRHLQQILRTKCSLCEVDPQNQACFYADLVRDLPFRYLEPFRIRWIIPVCLSCPFLERDPMEDKVVLELTGVDRDFKLQVVDNKGNIVAEGQPSEGTLRVSFMANRGRNYAAEVISGTTPSGATLNIAAKLTRNGSLQELPSIGK